MVLDDNGVPGRRPFYHKMVFIDNQIGLPSGPLHACQRCAPYFKVLSLSDKTMKEYCQVRGQKSS